MNTIYTTEYSIYNPNTVQTQTKKCNIFIRLDLCRLFMEGLRPIIWMKTTMFYIFTVECMCKRLPRGKEEFVVDFIW